MRVQRTGPTKTRLRNIRRAPKDVAQVIYTLIAVKGLNAKQIMHKGYKPRSIEAALRNYSSNPVQIMNFFAQSGLTIGGKPLEGVKKKSKIRH